MFTMRTPISVEGFPPNLQDELENMIDCFTPMDGILSYCKIQYKMYPSDLDEFCRNVYNMNFKDAYIHLLKMADMAARRAVTCMAKDGNKTAMSIMSDYFAEWSKGKDVGKQQIIINASMPCNKEKE